MTYAQRPSPPDLIEDPEGAAAYYAEHPDEADKRDSVSQRAACDVNAAAEHALCASWRRLWASLLSIGIFTSVSLSQCGFMAAPGTQRGGVACTLNPCRVAASVYRAGAASCQQHAFPLFHHDRSADTRMRLPRSEGARHCTAQSGTRTRTKGSSRRSCPCG